MKSLSLTNRRIETILYVLIWLLVFSIPYFNERIANVIHWRKLTNDWLHLSSLLILFLINVYLLVPKLLFNKKYLFYFGIVAFLIGGVMMAEVAIEARRIPPDVPEFGRLHEIGRPQGDFRPGLPRVRQKTLLMVLFDGFLLGLLVVGAGTAMKLVSKWLSEEKLRKDIEKEQLKTNLALLRHQVSPHFLMNTLNNIHALIDINTENAKDAIVRLSTLMRYLLYDSAQGHIKLRKEVEFIQSYISLMQLRFSENVEITVVIPESVPDVQLPPMLLTSFLENAFKHGVNYQSNSYIYFELIVNEKELRFIIRNSMHLNNEHIKNEYSGIGLENIKRSLALLYGDHYSLTITDKEKEFAVNLILPL